MRVQKEGIEPLLFTDRAALRQWFSENHNTLVEAFIGYYKKNTGLQSVSYKEAVEEALCFGWIDGMVLTINESVYCNRYTPRTKKSIWSAVNIKKVEELKAQGLMTEAGLAVFENRDVTRMNLYSHELPKAVLPEAFQKLLNENKTAYAYFYGMPASYQKAALHWVMSAKQESTRQKRMHELLTDSAAGRKVKPLSF